MSIPDDLGPDGIYDAVIECTVLFASITRQARPDTDERENGVDGEVRRKTERQSIEDMEQSFDLWIDFIGALADDFNRSLFARLHAHQDIKNMVVELLQMLIRNLEYLHHCGKGSPELSVEGDGNEGNGDQEELEEEARGAIQIALEELHFMARAIRRATVDCA